MTRFPKLTLKLLLCATIAAAAAPAWAGQRMIITYNDIWKYQAPTAETYKADWNKAEFDDSKWQEGQGLLGFENDPLPAPGIRTQIAQQGTPTYLFRKTFEYGNDPAGAKFAIDTIIDDAATYYLNGVKLGSVRHTPGEWNNNADTGIQNAVEELNILRGAATSLRKGKNVLAVEVHNNHAGGSDVVFGMRFLLGDSTYFAVIQSKDADPDVTAWLQHQINFNAGRNIHLCGVFENIGRLKIPPDTGLVLEPGAVLQARALTEKEKGQQAAEKSTSGEDWPMITLSSGSSIRGPGKIDGNRNARQTGSGIVIANCGPCEISGIQVTECSVDGIFFQNSQSVLIEGCNVSSNGRRDITGINSLGARLPFNTASNVSLTPELAPKSAATAQLGK